MRRFVSLLAVLGVLLHAAALVRHNAISLASWQSASASTADTAVVIAFDGEQTPICHTGAGAASLPSGAPGGSDKSSCPICTGLSAAVALSPPIHALVGAVVSARVVFSPVADQCEELLKRIRPPGRGPPLNA